MSKDVVKGEDSFKSMKKSLKRDYDAAKVVFEDGFLKSPMDYAGLLLERHRECLLHYLDSGDTNYLRGILCFVSRSKDAEKLSGYAEYLMPVHVVHYGDSVKISRRGDNYEPIEVFDFHIYKKLISVMKVSNSNLKKLKVDVEKIYSGGWKKGVERLFKWPSTEAPESLRSLFVDGWVKEGMLQHYNYHVGNGSRSDSFRQQQLRRLMSEDFDDKIFAKNYILSWGEPLSIARLMKLANTIASMCRNAKRSPHDYEKAIAEWERDLEYLRKKYYEQLLGWEQVEWPSTDL